MKTTGRWSWKSSSAKECVTTHLSNESALKIDGAKTSHLSSTVASKGRSPVRQTAQRVGVRGGRKADLGATRIVAASSADLGGSSKYSNGNLERRSGARFHENSS